MATVINQKIVGYSVTDKASPAPAPAPALTVAPTPPLERMHEELERPESLSGATYKIKSPLLEHAIYVSINDIVLNQGTQHEQRHPFEVFINSKNMEQFQWIVALTRIMSAVFRKGGDITFMVEELKAVFDPRGGYFKPGGVYMPSIVAEIGAVIEQHLKGIGLIDAPELSDAQRALVAEKRQAFEAKAAGNKPAAPACDASTCNCAEPGGCAAANEAEATSFPATASLCVKCNTKALVLLDGCQTCLNCGFSKCG